MMCENCNKRQATTYYKENINGEVKEMHLCSECASEMGIGMTAFSGFDFLFPSFVSSQKPIKEAKKCVCGRTLAQIADTGFVGCAECYKTFAEELSSTIRKTHGGRRHISRNKDSEKEAQSSQVNNEITEEKSVEELKKMLESAIKAENFEQAVILRDKIKKKENQSK